MTHLVHVCVSAGGVRYIRLPSTRVAFRIAMADLAIPFTCRDDRPGYRVESAYWPQVIQTIADFYPRWRLFHATIGPGCEPPPWASEAMTDLAARGE